MCHEHKAREAVEIEGRKIAVVIDTPSVPERLNAATRNVVLSAVEVRKEILRFRQSHIHNSVPLAE
jgi:hypothetical protein